MFVIYLMHPRYHAMTLIPFLERNGWYVPHSMPDKALHGASSCVWMVPGTWNGE